VSGWVSGYELPDMVNGMKHTNKTFVSETIVIDGEEFDGCAFRHCTIQYNGGEPPIIVNCHFDPPTAFLFADGAGRTMAWLRALSNMNTPAALAFEQLIQAINQDAAKDKQEDDEDEFSPLAKTFDFLGSHGQHAICVARIAAMFSALEYQLCQLFAWMLQCYPQHAAAAYWQLQPRARLEMLTGLITYLHSEEERIAVGAILDAFGSGRIPGGGVGAVGK